MLARAGAGAREPQLSCRGAARLVTMRQLVTEIDIDAPPERVWEVLTDFASFPEWNPFLRKAEGELSVGSRLKVRMEPPEGKGMTFRPRVLVAEPNHELRWLGRLLVPGLADGEHVFSLESLGNGRTHLVHREEFRGPLWALLKGTLRRTELGFHAMNAALKKRTESKAA